LAGAAPNKPAVVRALPPEEKVKPKPTMPSPGQLGIDVERPTPEQLGIAVPTRTPVQVDWSLTRQRLQQMGALTFQLDWLPEDGRRFSITLPTAEAGKAHLIQGDGATEADAVRQALERADAFRNQGK
jgi:hypothetical protein